MLLRSVLQEEIQLQKSKLERVEKERNELRLNTDRLESRVGLPRMLGGRRLRSVAEWHSFSSVKALTPCAFLSLSVCVCVQIADLLAELADERSTSESASQMLETETSERLRLEKDLKDLQAHMNTNNN